VKGNGFGISGSDIVGTKIDTTPGREGQLQRLNRPTNNKIDGKAMVTYFYYCEESMNSLRK